MDSDEEVAVMAAAASAAATLVTIMDDFMDVDCHGSGGEQALLQQLQEQEDDEEEVKHTRRSYTRPDYWGSTWGSWLRELQRLSALEGGLDPRCREATQFVKTFRITYPFFVHLMESVSPVFSSATHDVAGRECPPVELKVLGALKVLAAGNSFSDVASLTDMSSVTVETSFHHFCEKFSEGLWDTWVKLPTGDELRKVEEVYRKCGYPGAIGSVDCTHVKWETCPFSEQRIHTGKEGYPTLAFEVICDHSGRILAGTKSYPGAENDKTIVARDKSIWRVRDEEPWKSLKYELYDADGEKQERTGAWFIVDGGYPKIPLLIPPIKKHKNKEEHRWSRRTESMRKDIECCFGRVKGRCRLFKNGILFSSREKIDNAWFSACILHNMLHAFHNLGNLHEAPEWEGSAGPLDSNAVPTDVDEGSNDVIGAGFHDFRKALVTHFDRALKKNEITWFKRNPTCP